MDRAGENLRTVTKYHRQYPGDGLHKKGNLPQDNMPVNFDKRKVGTRKRNLAPRTSYPTRWITIDKARISAGTTWSDLAYFLYGRKSQYKRIISVAEGKRDTEYVWQFLMHRLNIPEEISRRVRYK